MTRKPGRVLGGMAASGALIADVAATGSWLAADV
jgi:hypothetical protein